MNRLVALLVSAVSVTAIVGCSTETETPEARFVPTSLALEPESDFKVGSSVQLRVFGLMEGWEKQELASEVTYASTNEAVATVDETGLVTLHAGGLVTITATAAGLETALEVRSTCADYPRYTSQIGYGRTMPPLSWPAKWPDGTDFRFSMESVHCDYDWEEIETITFVLSAGWCAPCTAYAQRLKGETNLLKHFGMQLVIVEVQDVQGDPADLEFAYNHLKRITSNAIPSIAIGDKDTEPFSSFFENSGYIEYFPTTFVLRTRDMKIIADQKRGDGYLPLMAIAKNPDGDWSRSGNPVFVNHCGPGDEEASEPNDVPAKAAALSPGSHHGGICTDAPDLYRIDLVGAWSLQLEFDHDVGDLDLYVWDPERNEPALIDGGLIGSSNGTGVEIFEHFGPAMIGVMPFRSASAPYTITLTEL